MRMPRNRCHHSPERHRSVTGRLDQLGSSSSMFSFSSFQFVLNEKKSKIPRRLNELFLKVVGHLFLNLKIQTCV